MPLTPEILDEAMRLRATGLLWREVAEQLSVHVNTLHKYLRRTGRVVPERMSTRKVAVWPKQVIRDAHRRCVQGERVEDVAATLGISVVALRSQFVKKGYPPLRPPPERWTAKEVRQAYERYVNGEDRHAIAASFGTSWVLLYGAMRRRGYYTREIGNARRRHDNLGRQVWRMRMEGISIKEIAERLGAWEHTSNPAQRVSQCLYTYCKRNRIVKPPRKVTSPAKPPVP